MISARWQVAGGRWQVAGGRWQFVPASCPLPPASFQRYHSRLTNGGGMETRSIWRVAYLAIGVVAIALAFASIRMTGQSAARDARMPDGKPNLNGIWRAMNTANWDLLAHTVRPAV